MDDFKTIARIMAAIKASENSSTFNVSLVDPRLIKATAADRDRLALKLQKEALIEGLFVIDGIDNQSVPVVLWDRSKPAITIKGLEFMRSNDPFRKAVSEIKETVLATASVVLGNAIMQM